MLGLITCTESKVERFTIFMFHALEKEMAAHSSILAWRIPRTEEPSGIQSMGSQRVGHDLATKQQQHQYQWFEYSNNLQMQGIINVYY